MRSRIEVVDVFYSSLGERMLPPTGALPARLRARGRNRRCFIVFERDLGTRSAELQTKLVELINAHNGWPLSGEIAEFCRLPPRLHSFFLQQAEILQSGAMIRHRDGARMVCLRGYELIGNGALECNLGKWLKVAGECEPSMTRE